LWVLDLMIGFIRRLYYDYSWLLRITAHTLNSFWTISDESLWRMIHCCLTLGLASSPSNLSLSLMLRPTVSRPVCLGIKHPSGAYDQNLLLSEISGLVDMGRFLWWEDGSVVYNCCWPSPAHSFSGPSPVGLANVFYRLRFEKSLFVASYDSEGHGGGIRPRLHTEFRIVATLNKTCNFCGWCTILFTSSLR
jgi:hypothetical protein